MNQVLRSTLIATSLVGCLSPAAIAQTTITTEPFGEGITYSSYPEQTIGQTFRAPNSTDVFLSSFRLAVGSAPTVPYTVRLMEWDPVGTRAGNVLFSQAIAATPGSPPPEYVTFDVQRLLQYGTDYIFAYSLAGATFAYGYVSGANPYSEGSEWLIRSADLNDLQHESTRTWYTFTNYDVGFTAEFEPHTNVVPEPASMALLGTGLLGLAASRRRRKQRPEPGA